MLMHATLANVTRETRAKAMRAALWNIKSNKYI